MASSFSSELPLDFGASQVPGRNLQDAKVVGNILPYHSMPPWDTSSNMLHWEGEGKMVWDLLYTIP